MEAAIAANEDPGYITREHQATCPPEPHCFRCGRTADEAFRIEAEVEEITPELFAVREEGTYNRVTNHFACDGCYIAIGMPASERGWVAP